MRKRAQVDNYNELPTEKRPPEDLIWWGYSEDIDHWFDKVYKRNENTEHDIMLEVDDSEIE